MGKQKPSEDLFGGALITGHIFGVFAGASLILQDANLTYAFCAAAGVSYSVFAVQAVRLFTAMREESKPILENE